jgi:hypothetical protein
MCMRLEYLANGSPDCPLIRLYDFTRDEARSLRRIFYSLANGTLKSVALEQESFVVPLGECQLVLAAQGQDAGICANGPTSFECRLTEFAWDTVAGLTDPFCDSEMAGGHQWLTTAGQVGLLISRDGKW